MNPLLHQFLLEAREFIQELSAALLQLERDPADETRIALVFRLFHTLKGNSGLFEFKTMTQLLHASEDLLDAVRSKELALNDHIIDLLLRVIDLLQFMFDDIEQHEALLWQPEDLPALIAALQACLSTTGSHPAQQAISGRQGLSLPDCSWLALVPEAQRFAVWPLLPDYFYMVHYQPEAECFFKGDDPVLTFSQLPGLLLVKMLSQRAWPAAELLDVYSCNLQFYGLSQADEASLTQHFLYVADQVQFQQIPRWVFAIPQGELQAMDPYTDFLQVATDLIDSGKFDELAAGVAGLLEMLNPALWLASAMRWLQRCLAAGAPVSVLHALLKAAVSGQQPDWQQVLQQTHITSNAPVSAPISGAFPELARQVISAQLSILTTLDPMLPGQIKAVHQSLLAVSQSLDLPQARALVAMPAESLSFAVAKQLFAELIGDATTPESYPAAKDTLQAAVSTPESSTGATELLLDRRRDDAHDKVRVLKVPQEKIDALLDLVGEMVVAKNALPYLINAAESLAGSRELTRELKAYAAQLHRLSEEMRDGIMQVRMLPVGTVFQRFPRLVRDVAKKLGKEVTLLIEGEDTEADKQIVESLSDPLVHILRNSLDHGLETPDERRRLGKPAAGRLTIRALQEGDRVRIEIEDDGRGIDPAKIKQKAYAKGLIDEQKLHNISDEEAVNLVFLPGFSTAEAVSDLSGRGVGMDVVRSSLEKIGGAVQLSSVVGQHTRLLLSLPLSVSVSRVMLVRVDGQLFGIPLDLVVETVRVPQSRLHPFGQQQATVLRDKLVPLYAAHQLLGFSAQPLMNDAGELSILVVRFGQEPMGLLVDGFAQTMDLLLKPLEGALAGLPGYAGTALLGNGTVLLVLDLKELLRCQ